MTLTMTVSASAQMSLIANAHVRSSQLQTTKCCATCPTFASTISHCESSVAQPSNDHNASSTNKALPVARLVVVGARRCQVVGQRAALYSDAVGKTSCCLGVASIPQTTTGFDFDRTKQQQQTKNTPMSNQSTQHTHSTVKTLNVVQQEHATTSYVAFERRVSELAPELHYSSTSRVLRNSPSQPLMLTTSKRKPTRRNRVLAVAMLVLSCYLVGYTSMPATNFNLDNNSNRKSSISSSSGSGSGSTRQDEPTTTQTTSKQTNVVVDVAQQVEWEKDKQQTTNKQQQPTSLLNEQHFTQALDELDKLEAQRVASFEMSLDKSSSDNYYNNQQQQQPLNNKNLHDDTLTQAQQQKQLNYQQLALSEQLAQSKLISRVLTHLQLTNHQLDPLDELKPASHDLLRNHQNTQNTHLPSGNKHQHLSRRRLKRSGISDQRLAEIQTIRALKKHLQRAAKLAAAEQAAAVAASAITQQQELDEQQQQAAELDNDQRQQLTGVKQ